MFKARSNSTTSVGSTLSTCSTRSTQDMIAHIVAQEPDTIYLWSAGNFEFVQIDYLDTEGDEWKASYRIVA
ncbi:hypothetical protein CspHIS471_0405000 [Cutaneotrichosporon sp. HIS471]|nr:hypothetical protein CspHIS471_0405000 [Cutaneotrichosporon sp. HIS471]